jgi:DnaK suppressor protein
VAKKASKTTKKKSTRKTASGSGSTAATAAKSSKSSKSSRSSKKTAGTTKTTRSTATTKAKAKTNGSRRPAPAKTSRSRKAPASAAKSTAAPAVNAAPVQDERVRNSNGQLSDEELRKVKTGLSKKQLAEFRSMLLEKRAELVGDVQGMEAARAEGNSEHLSPEHMADMGSDAFEQEFTLGLMESERRLLHDIHEALERIEKGTYGVCLESGLPIPRARLEIKPWARYTIDVVRERERRGLKV